jgi:geranylgeranyl pyrophosphate synthase
MGKPRGTDIYEGKMTLPIIHALTSLHGNDRKNLADVLMDFNDDRWDELISLLDTAGSIDYVRSLIDSHVQRAIEALEPLPNSNQLQLMAKFARKSALRTL